MDPNEVIDIKNKIASLGESIDDISKVVSALKIDKQIVILSNAPIPPGTACRLTFDSKGLILKGEDLRIDDIPDIPLGKITGLEKILNNKLEATSVSTTDAKTVRAKIKAGTGIKINYDEDGLITSSADLLLSDIPDLSIAKIIGLGDRLTLIESQFNTISDEVKVSTIIPGTFPKITYGPDGKVISGCKLSIDDIPIDLITKLNILESRIPQLASQQTLDALVQDVQNKINFNTSITPGVYTKVKVDGKGLVTFGNILDITDLPEIQIKDITNLDSSLRKKADQSDLVELMNTVSSLSNNNGSSEIVKMQNDLSTKANDEDLKNTNNKVENLQRVFTSLIDTLPSEFIVNQLKQIQDTLSTLGGRVTTLERQLKIPV